MHTFYLGTHEPSWLGRVSVPLCISDHRLVRRKSYPRALGPWMLDSGGFTVLSTHGRHVTKPAVYAERVQRYASDIGNLTMCAIQDWMCEPMMLAKTGRTVEQHQRLTVESYCELQAQAPDMPWMPIVQGWSTADYLRHVALYDQAGINLSTLPAVGVGSICRRQGTKEAVEILSSLSAVSDHLHAFGVKITGLRNAADSIATADSMAWSFSARRGIPLPGHTHRNCANCLEYALGWRSRVIHG